MVGGRWRSGGKCGCVSYASADVVLKNGQPVWRVRGPPGEVFPEHVGETGQDLAVDDDFGLGGSMRNSVGVITSGSPAARHTQLTDAALPRLAVCRTETMRIPLHLWR